MGDNVNTTVGTTIAAESVDKVLGRYAGKAGGKVGGALVQPVVWIATGTKPDAGDVFLYGAGLVVAVPALITGLVKAAVDDHTAKLVAAAAQDEPVKYRPHVKACSDYGFFEQGGAISSMTIASKGGVAWRKKNGLWLYITDAKDRLIADYKPHNCVEVRGPTLPLKPAGSGRFKWESRRA